MLKGSILALALMFVAVPCGAESPEFVAGTVDLPLMPGLEGAADGPVVFDSPAGRIVESWAVGKATTAAVDAFYADSLPQLGWRQTGPATYRRESEVLTIETESVPEGVTIRFQIAPDVAGEG